MKKVLALTAALLLVFAACGNDDDADDGASDPDVDVVDDAGDGDDGGGSAAPSVDPCDLFTIEDLTSRGIVATDGPIKQDAAFEGAETCSFGDDQGSSFGVTITVYPPNDGAFGIGDAEQIPGIGAETIYSPSARTIYIQLDDGTHIDIFAPITVGPDDPRDALIELAQIAVS